MSHKAMKARWLGSEEAWMLGSEDAGML